MLFYSPIFLFLFLPILFISYFIASEKFKDLVLLFGSSFFYFWAEPHFFFIALASAIIDYILCLYIFKWQNTKKSTLLMALGILLNVLLLSYFKYVDFFVSSTNAFLAHFNIHALPLLNIALPVGVSFIVFEKITYLVDVYKKIGPPATSLQKYLVYIFLFPKLLAGPIVKYHDISQQLLHRSRNEEDDLFIGLKRFLIGFVKKILLADTIGELANTIFGLPSNQLGFINAWLGVFCFTLQIYLDFSSYSDMAIGLARIFGFRLLENFNMPYTAVNFTDFWRRWHISLSTWIKEYLYIPLGGNRAGVLRTYFNLWICFLICGLWHGANWTFVLWGVYNGFFLVLDKLFWLKISNVIPKILNVTLTFLFVMCGWVIFRATSLEQMNSFFIALTHPLLEGTHLYITSNIWAAICVGALISFIPLSNVYHSALKIWRSNARALIIENWFLSAFSLFAMMRIVTSTFNPFLYFRF